MTITAPVFEAFLKCPTKCWLRAKCETPSGNTYAEWVQSQNESFRATQLERLLGETPGDDVACSPSPECLKASKWRLAVDVVVRMQAKCGTRSVGCGMEGKSLATSAAAVPGASRPPDFIAESRVHVLERVPPEGRGRAAQLIPTRCIFFNKLGKDDKLLVAFDAFVLSAALGREIRIGKLIHGDDHSTLQVKTSAKSGEVRQRLQEIAALLSRLEAPDLVLNRHCAECEFQSRCRQKTVEKDDLSLLAGMSAKERKKLHSKGIFTVTQLSYTFRPRRRPKRLRDKREKYHHSLKALAIREKKIHIVGNPELKIDGTPVYLDVEGLPDRDFYYLIGMRIGKGESAIQHSLWADTIEDEGKIWREFLGILQTVEGPVLMHYGSYEATFFYRLCKRHGKPPDNSIAAKAMRSSVNLLAVIFARVYFPTFSNGLKEAAEHLGFRWLDSVTSGLDSIALRSRWAESRDEGTKTRLLAYNAQDCEAACMVEAALSRIGTARACQQGDQSVVHADSLRPEKKTKWATFNSPIPNLQTINDMAHWDYNRDRVRVRPLVGAQGTGPDRRRGPNPAQFKNWLCGTTSAVAQGARRQFMCPANAAQRFSKILCSAATV